MKTIAFDFDLGLDTAADVAGEMVDEMHLSAGDTASIAAAIRAEVHMLTGTSTPHTPSLMHQAAQLHTPKGTSGASEGTAAAASPMHGSSADLHDISSPMSVAVLSAGQPVSTEEDLHHAGSSPDENWSDSLEPGTAPGAAADSGSPVAGRSPDHRASLSRLLTPRKRGSSTHMKRLLSQVPSLTCSLQVMLHDRATHCSAYQS